ncbi:endo-1,3(4)-beta-glucanase [Planoprotostelium fungivorum]|uniref:Endo-1,3(4)-beta-glucanase n=1 Tax=Planoprotostelium fungivorum TaxID=1890364 RepID=A0A2P6MVG3_9EUKA|nr:endo-1,3(4)-beta-glucanase [Planoprotostelium fungivorum]
MALKVILISLTLLGSGLADSNWAGSLDYGIDRPGEDLPNQPVDIWPTSTAVDCQWKCYIEPRCVAWAYDSCSHTRCWLKSSAPAGGAMACRDSGVMAGRAPAPAPVPTPTKTTDDCKYSKSWNLTGSSFFDGFDFYTGADPTHGSVQYLNRQDAANRGLIKVINGSAYIGVDNTNKQSNGRPSVRIESKKSFTTGLMVIDLEHIPDNACGLWPAIWTSGPNWPNGGEIDILEGVNLNTQNQITLHTGGHCVVGDATQKGDKVGNDCQVSHSSVGCGVKTNTEGAFGTLFNWRGGGAYVVERSTQGIKVWFFRTGSYPTSLLTDTPNVCEFGTPEASFPFSDCNQDQFGPQKIIINISFCGDWADAPGLFNQGGCSGSCASYVANTPEAFKYSYFTVRSLRMFNH